MLHRASTTTQFRFLPLPPVFRELDGRSLGIASFFALMFAAGEDQTDPDGTAVALVDIVDVHAWRASELEAACARKWTPGLWAWRVANVRPIGGAVRVVARRKLYEVEISGALFTEGI